VAFFISTGVKNMVLKTTPIIDEINEVLSQGYSGKNQAMMQHKMHELAVRAAEGGQEFTHLDCLALGRVRGQNRSDFYSAWQRLMRPFSRIDDQRSISLRVGTIAARVELFNQGNENALADTNLSLRDQSPKQFDRTSDFLATTHTAARFHPDQAVRNIAAWAEGHLEQRVAKQLGLIPE
jgi:hypothetical protein